MSTRERTDRIQRLALRLLATEAELRELAGGEIDALVDPRGEVPLLLRDAQEALREAEARARALIERLPILACELGPDGTTRFVNDAVTTILGYEPHELVGRPWWEALGVESTDPAIPGGGDGAGLDVDGDEVTDVERTVLAKYGGLRHMIWTSKHLVLPDGTSRGVLLFGLDLTERLAAEEAARRLIAEQSARAAAEEAERRSALLAEAGRLLGSALRYEATLTSIARLAVSGIAEYCIVDLLEDETRLRRIDVAHPDVTGVDALRERLAEQSPGEGPHIIRSVILEGASRVIGHATLEDGVDLVDEELASRVEGRSIVCAPLSARGHTLGTITVLSASGEPAYGAADVALVEELARRAGIAVDNARLYEAALSASDAKSQFLAMMSHELRTPLNAIMGYADLLLLGIPERVPESSGQQVRRIRVAATHLLQMIDEILSLSRIEAGEEVIDADTFELCAFVRETASLVEPLAESKGLSFTCRVPEGEIEVTMDARKVRQILLNLLGNAVKFTSEGEVGLDARVDDGSVVIRVRDTGIGIATEHQERIFEPFWQVARSAGRAFEGTGLGLNVALRLARAMGGDLSIDSQPGRGTALELRLPRVHEGGRMARRRTETSEDLGDEQPLA